MGRHAVLGWMLLSTIGLGMPGLAGCTGSSTPAPEAASTREGRQPPSIGPAASSSHDPRTKTLEHIHHYQTIALTSEQQQIRTRALSAIPAPCCSNYTAATCCCECNLARSIWGLSNTLIIKGAGVEEIRQVARDWIETVNPSGFTGDACVTGGCGRPFRENGCGGMSATNLL